jgi:hypothetical protein
MAGVRVLAVRHPEAVCTRRYAAPPGTGGPLRRNDEPGSGRSAPSVPLAWPPPRGGDFTLSVVDEHGASASRVMRVDPQP